MPTTDLREPPLGLRFGLVFGFAITAVLLLAVPSAKWIAWVLLVGLATGLAALYRTRFGRDFLVLVSLLTLLGLTPIHTSLKLSHMLSMGVILLIAVAAPYIYDHYIIKEKRISFPFRLGRRWQRREIGYIVLTLVVSYLLMPWYLGQGSYHNWEVGLDPASIVRLFIGTNALGIWDELFFIGTVLTLLRAHLPFFWANLTQSVLFTSFLYELGFRGIGPLMIFFFTLSQGYIFTRSKSFLYIVTIHLIIDFVLFLTLIHLHHPEYLRIFITSPF